MDASVSRVPCVPVLAQVLHTLGEYLGVESEGRPGRQHRLDAAYFERIEAMDYTLTHDDGQLLNSLDAADIILLGVSRTSKTPTALYLANRGYKVANVPLVSGMPVPPQIRAVRGRLIVGLTNDPVRLTQLRRNRMLMLRQETGKRLRRSRDGTPGGDGGAPLVPRGGMAGHRCHPSID